MIKQQTCKVCGCRDRFDFHVSDEVWKAVVPARFDGKVVCLACFDDFARRNQIDYTGSLRTLYFAGEHASFEFRMVSGATGDRMASLHTGPGLS